MKILHIISTLNIGGAEKLVTDSVPFYCQKGIRVDVLSLQKSDTVLWDKLKSDKNIETKYLTDGSIYNPTIIFKIIPFLKKYDIIHIHLFPTLYWVVIAKIISFTKVKLIYTEHSTSNKRRNKSYFAPIDRFIYNKLDEIICISLGVKLSLDKHLKIKEKSLVINNGIKLLDFKENEKINKLIYFCKNDFVLIQVSSFRKPKDQPTVIKSLLLLPKHVKLLLVGDGELIYKSKDLVKELGLENRVLFLGNRMDIPDLLNYSDVIILSSEYEGFGLAIVEGMASRRPVIASNVLGLDEIVKGHGLLFSKGNYTELAQLVNRLLNDKLYYEEIANKCYVRAFDFDLNYMVDNYIWLYNKIYES